MKSKILKGRVSFIEDLEYKEIKPIRPNQSVVISGLGVNGIKKKTWKKDRGYRSSQGAGFSDGLVLHSARPRTQQGWPAEREVILDEPSASAHSRGSFYHHANANHVMMSNSCPQSGHRNQQDPQNGIEKAYQTLFSKHLNTIIGINDGSGQKMSGSRSSSKLGKHIEYACQDGGPGYRSVRCWSRNTQDGERSRPISRLVFIEEERPVSQARSQSQSAVREVSFNGPRRHRDNSWPGREPTSVSRPVSRSGFGSSQRLIRVESAQGPFSDDFREHHTRETGSQTPGDLSNYTEDADSDEELSLLGDSIVREALNHAGDPMDKSADDDLTELAEDLMASDLREDQFTEKDYFRAGMLP